MEQHKDRGGISACAACDSRADGDLAPRPTNRLRHFSRLPRVDFSLGTPAPVTSPSVANNCGAAPDAWDACEELISSETHTGTLALGGSRRGFSFFLFLSPNAHQLSLSHITQPRGAAGCRRSNDMFINNLILSIFERSLHLVSRRFDSSPSHSLISAVLGSPPGL